MIQTEFKSTVQEDADTLPQIAVFDLDVTLTQYDTYLPFLTGYLRRHPRRALNLLQLPIRLLAFWHWGDRDWVKSTFLKAFIGGEPRRRVTRWAETFSGRIYRNAMRPYGLERLRWHQSRGDRVIIASASFDVYVDIIARILGVDEVLASNVRWDTHDHVDGIEGRNCHDHEKLRRVQALLGDDYDGAVVVAYSDSHADVPLLGWVDKGVAVCPTHQLTHSVAGLGLEVQHW